MKITMEVDCTPEEARRFFGLPDVAALHAAMTGEMEDRVKEAMKTMEPEALMKTWMPEAASGLDQMQKMFWNALSTGPGGADNSKKKKEG